MPSFLGCKPLSMRMLNGPMDKKVELDPISPWRLRSINSIVSYSAVLDELFAMSEAKYCKYFH